MYNFTKQPFGKIRTYCKFDNNGSPGWVFLSPSLSFDPFGDRYSLHGQKKS